VQDELAKAGGLNAYFLLFSTQELRDQWLNRYGSLESIISRSSQPYCVVAENDQHSRLGAKWGPKP
jgi:hypothetical protein